MGHDVVELTGDALPLLGDDVRRLGVSFGVQLVEAATLVPAERPRQHDRHDGDVEVDRVGIAGERGRGERADQRGHQGDDGGPRRPEARGHVERHEHAEVQERVGVVQHPEHPGGRPRHHQDGDGRPAHPDDRQRLGQEEHDRGHREARLARFAGDERGAADLDGGQAQRDAQVDDDARAARTRAAATSSCRNRNERRAHRHPHRGGTSSPMRGTRKRRLPADDTGGRDP